MAAHGCDTAMQSTGCLRRHERANHRSADPETAPVFVYGFLEVVAGPQIATGPIRGVDGVEISVVFDFGVGAVDWRGGWFNPGV